MRDERGYTLVEMLTVLVIFSTVMSALLVLFVNGTNAELDLNNRFQAQQDARLALDKLRRDVHCAYDANPNSPNPWTSAQSTVTLKITSCGGGDVTWCTAAMTGLSNRWALYRQGNSTTCSSSSPAVKIASYLATQTPFTVFAHPTGSLASLSVSLPVGVNRNTSTGIYRLQDTIYLRNSTRP